MPAIQANTIKQKTTNATTGVAVVVAADYGEGGYLEDAGASDDTIYRLWLRTASGNINLGEAGHGSDDDNDAAKLIKVSTTDALIGDFRRSDLEGLYMYGTAKTVYINVAKVIKYGID